MKPDSLYNSGMKPLFYSEKKAKYESKLWGISKKLDGFGMDMIFAIIRTIWKGKMDNFTTASTSPSKCLVIMPLFRW